MNTDNSTFGPTSAKHKIVPSEVGFSAFVSSSGVKPVGLTANVEFVFRSSFSLTKTETNSTPAPSPTPSAGATVSVTGLPADPTYSNNGTDAQLTVSLGYVLLIAAGMYVLGRIHQYSKDEKRGLGPKPPKGGQS